MNFKFNKRDNWYLESFLEVVDFWKKESEKIN